MHDILIERMTVGSQPQRFVKILYVHSLLYIVQENLMFSDLVICFIHCYYIYIYETINAVQNGTLYILTHS